MSNYKLHSLKALYLLNPGNPGNLIIYWTYSRQSLLNLKNLRFTPALDYNAMKRIKYLKINRKFQVKRINGRKYGPKSLHRQWDTNSGVHWEVLIPISLSVQSIHPRYLSALLNVRSLSRNLLQILHLLESSSLYILALTETWTKQNQSLEIVQGTLSTMGYSLDHHTDLAEKEEGWDLSTRIALKLRRRMRA